MSEDQFIHIFLEESRENLQSIEEGLLQLEKAPHDLEIINVVFRGMHTIKGGAGLMGLSRIGSLTHQMESILERLRSSGGEVTEELFNLLFSGNDLLRQIFESNDLEGETFKEKVEELIEALELYSEGDGNCSITEEKSILGEDLYEYDWFMIEKALAEGEKIYQIRVHLQPDCLLKSVRVFMVFQAVGKQCEIIKAVPSLEILEAESFDLEFDLLVLGNPDMDELRKTIEGISEVQKAEVTPLKEDDDLEKLLTGEQLDLHDKEPIHEENRKEKQKYYKILLKLPNDIFEMGIDPLVFIFELNDSGIILENYLNFAGLPELSNLDTQSLYVFWTIFYESDKGQKEIENIFLFAGEEHEITVEDISGQLDLWFGGEKRTGELLIDRGLVTAENVEEALKKQKRIGELLVEQGKVTSAQVEKVIQTQTRSREKEQVDTIRVDTHKLENILNYIAELLIAQSHVKEMVIQHAGAARTLSAEVLNTFEEVDKIIRHLQEEVMNASMVPVGETFTRFQRMVRDLARDLGKEVELVISGRETELDKKVIEQIADPLKHLIRNAVDHGLEGPDERMDSGKNRSGTIHLNAYHQEGNIVIEISDDGRGINEEAILAKAREKKLIAEGESLTSTEIHRLLFMPGFSTAKEVSDVSGRGVGLDVVMNNIENLRGRVEIFSQKGKGTRISIKLPLTLAIIDGIMVRVGEERFIIPLTSITEFIKAGPGDIRKAEGKGQIMHLRKEYMPFNSLYLLLNIQPDSSSPLDGILVILQDGQKKLALLVDEIIRQEQVVIKSVKECIEDTEGIAGATILGDGAVAFILDVSSLFRMSRSNVVGEKLFETAAPI